MNNPLQTPVARGRRATSAWLALLLVTACSLAGARAQAATALQTEKPFYVSGEPVTVTFSGGPGNAKDWIGIYPANATPNGAYTDYLYTDGTQNGDVVVTDGTVTFTKGFAAAGSYKVHFLVNDGYTSAASKAFYVVASTNDLPVLLSKASNYYPGEQIAFTFRNGPGDPQDWIGVYQEGQTPGNVNSTIWRYVNNTQASTIGLSEGSVTFSGGLNFAGNWVGYFLLDDAYAIAATNAFSIVDPITPLVRVNKREFLTGEAITVTFTNTPGGAKDWIGIYKEGAVPSNTSASKTWLYINGTQTPTTGTTAGSVTFATGWNEPGNYVIHYLLNDGYDSLTTETITLRQPVAGQAPRIIASTPADGVTNLPPVLAFSATITNGTSKLATNTIVLKLDGVTVPHQLTVSDGGALVSYTSTPLPLPGSQHTWSLVFQDNAVPPATITREAKVTFGSYTNIVLPAPLYFESFDNVPEGGLPTGWTAISYFDAPNPEFDLGELGSAAYTNWITVSADRFKSSFGSYGNADNKTDDYRRVLTPNPFQVVNGQAITGPLATGRFLFGNSGYHASGGGQVMYAFTPDYDLTGKQDVHLSFHSLWEQNQDSIGAVEYSIDQGKTWLPVVYYLAGADILRVTNEVTGVVSVDATATFTTEYGDVAHYTDPVTGEDKGGTYGAFIGAEITQTLAPYISARVDDNPTESKRVELFRLPQADNQAKVRIRFAHAGTDSWYFGIDDVGLYSIGAGTSPAAKLNIARSGNDVTISWASDASGFTLQSTDSLTNPSWQTVAGVSNNSIKVTASTGSKFYRLRK